jgi:hypothetical protein
LFDGLYADLSAEKHHDKNPGLRHGARDSGDRFISVDITREHDAHPCGREGLNELLTRRASLPTNRMPLAFQKSRGDCSA